MKTAVILSEHKILLVILSERSESKDLHFLLPLQFPSAGRNNNSGCPILAPFFQAQGWDTTKLIQPIRPTLLASCVKTGESHAARTL
jgi:hypothetical protein